MNAESMLPDWNIYYRNEYMKNVWLKECNKMIKDNTGMYSLKKIEYTFLFYHKFFQKITYFCQNSFHSAPTDCLQYHTGISGQFQSFNFNSGAGLTIANQNYNICIRQATGAKSITINHKKMINNRQQVKNISPKWSTTRFTAES